MINIVESPMRANKKMNYSINGDILIVTIDGFIEEFEFTGLPEGHADEVTPEILPINPILSAEKIGNEITISLIRFYGEDEKEVFEFVEDQMEI